MAAGGTATGSGPVVRCRGRSHFLFCWVEQVAEDGVLFSRIYQRGEVVGRGIDLVYIYLDGEGQVIGVPTHPPAPPPQ